MQVSGYAVFGAEDERDAWLGRDHGSCVWRGGGEGDVLELDYRLGGIVC